MVIHHDRRAQKQYHNNSFDGADVRLTGGKLSELSEGSALLRPDTVGLPGRRQLWTRDRRPSAIFRIRLLITAIRRGEASAKAIQME